MGEKMIQGTPTVRKDKPPSRVETKPGWSVVEILKVVLLFLVWYTLCGAYNVYNGKGKKDLVDEDGALLPFALACSQLMVGLFYAVPLWFTGTRKPPTMRPRDILTILPIALLNTVGHLAMVVAMGTKGGGSFTHVVKAAEPVVSVILSLLMYGLGTFPTPVAAMSLIPITYGVAFASTLGNFGDIGGAMTTLAAGMAMLSNVCFALRSILKKGLPDDFKTRTGLDAANEHCVTTLTSLALLTPPTLLLEGQKITTWLATSSPERMASAQWNLGICGMSWYLYNELQNIVLSMLGPVSTAVGNTLKRVAIFVGMYLFNEEEKDFPPEKVFGCVIAVMGCLAYAVCSKKKW